MNPALPGSDLIEAGVLELLEGRETIAALRRHWSAAASAFGNRAA